MSMLRPEEAIPEGRDGAPALVLVADDEPYNLDLLDRILRRAGYRVVTAASGAEALDKARQVHPDIALLDVMMPRMTGYDVCKELKDDPATVFLPVILLTALADLEDKVKSLDVGADDLLTKPVSRVELLARVRSLLRLKTLIEEKRKEEIERARLENQLEMERFKREEEVRRRAFYKEVIFAVTNGRLLLMEKDEMDDLLAQRFRATETVELANPRSVSSARHVAESLGGAIGIPEEVLHDVVLCVSEAATNVIKHANGGRMQVGTEGDRLLIYFEDHGKGIDATTLPRATLMKGYSTMVSLGFGFTILLELLDRVNLHTSPEGTRLLLEKGPAPAKVDMEDVLQRL